MAKKNRRRSRQGNNTNDKDSIENASIKEEYLNEMPNDNIFVENNDIVVIKISTEASKPYISKKNNKHIIEFKKPTQDSDEKLQSKEKQIILEDTTGAPFTKDFARSLSNISPSKNIVIGDSKESTEAKSATSNKKRIISDIEDTTETPARSKEKLISNDDLDDHDGIIIEINVFGQSSNNSSKTERNEKELLKTLEIKFNKTDMGKRMTQNCTCKQQPHCWAGSVKVVHSNSDLIAEQATIVDCTSDTESTSCVCKHRLCPKIGSSCGALNIDIGQNRKKCCRCKNGCCQTDPNPMWNSTPSSFCPCYENTNCLYENQYYMPNNPTQCYNPYC